MEQPLSSLNLSSYDYQSLKSLGYNYVNEVGENIIENLLNSQEWRKVTNIPFAKSALDIYQKNSELDTIYLFNKELDELLENEMVLGNIVEICGEAGSGKTQICFQLCVNVQLPVWLGGKSGGAMYLCTNYNFSVERIKDLSQQIVNKIEAMTFSTEIQALLNIFNVNSILQNIHHTQINTYDELLACIIYFKKWIRYNKIRLLVIDCITNIIQQLDYKEKRKFIYQIFAELQELAMELDFVIIITNNVTIRMKSINDIYKTPALGEAYYHRVNSRIMVKKVGDNCFKATLEKSVVKSNCMAIFQL